MLLTSLKDELKLAARKAENVHQLQSAKQLVALKLKRAFTAYKKSFADIENFAKGFQPVKKPGQQMRRPQQQPGSLRMTNQQQLRPQAGVQARPRTNLQPNK